MLTTSNCFNVYKMYGFKTSFQKPLLLIPKLWNKEHSMFSN